MRELCGVAPHALGWLGHIVSRISVCTLPVAAFVCLFSYPSLGTSRGGVFSLRVFFLSEGRSCAQFVPSPWSSLQSPGQGPLSPALKSGIGISWSGCWQGSFLEVPIGCCSPSLGIQFGHKRGLEQRSRRDNTTILHDIASRIFLIKSESPVYSTNV